MSFNRFPIKHLTTSIMRTPAPQSQSLLMNLDRRRYFSSNSDSDDSDPSKFSNLKRGRTSSSKNSMNQHVNQHQNQSISKNNINLKNIVPRLEFESENSNLSKALKNLHVKNTSNTDKSESDEIDFNHELGLRPNLNRNSDPLTRTNSNNPTTTITISNQQDHHTPLNMNQMFSNVFSEAGSHLQNQNLHHTTEDIDPTIPEWATQDNPIWLSMFEDFLFQRNPTCVLLDTDLSPLPIFLEEEINNMSGNINNELNSDPLTSESDSLSLEYQPQSVSSVVGGKSVVSQPESILMDFRYVHIPYNHLRNQITSKVHRSEPVAIFGGSSSASRKCEYILREELGYRKLCNVHTYSYLRRLVTVCARSRS